MARNRPCGVCGKWFHPNARLGDRQHTCGLPACKQEWHRRACAKWHARNPGYDQHTRLMTRLVKDPVPVGPTRHANALDQIDWTLAREKVGLPVAILVEETGKILLQRARDAIPA